MTQFEPKEPRPLDAAIKTIEQTAQNQDIDVYAEGKGPLTLAQLSPEDMVSEEVRAVTVSHDWPSMRNADAIEPVHAFSSAGEFVEALRGEGKPFLNNLNALFAAKRADTFSMGNVYGVNPALHRGYAIAPELFEGIRELYASFPPSIGYDDMTETLRSNPQVAGQMLKAFKILGRLVTADDYDRQLKQIDPNAKSVVVESAQTFLTT